MAARLADRGPARRSSGARRLPRVLDRRRFDPGGAHARRARSPRSTTRACTAGRGSPTGAVRSRTARSACPYHAWTYALDGRLEHVPDREEFAGLPDDLGLRAGARRLLGRLRVRQHGSRRRAAARLPRSAAGVARAVPLRRAALPHVPHARSSHANWKAVVDAFNESYHVQGLHEQILPWTDDTSIAYEQFERHSHYGRLPGARRELRPEPAPRAAARTTTTKARSSARSSPGSVVRFSARSARRSRSCARRGRRRARRCSARTRSAA